MCTAQYTIHACMFLLIIRDTTQKTKQHISQNAFSPPPIINLTPVSYQRSRIVLPSRPEALVDPAVRGKKRLVKNSLMLAEKSGITSGKPQPPGAPQYQDVCSATRSISWRALVDRIEE